MSLGKFVWGFVIKMIFGKKGQFFIFSGFLLLLVILYTYSVETENTYIVKTSHNKLLENIVYETCQIGKNSNGSYIESRYLSFTGNVSAYCNNLSYVCVLTIVNNTGLPTNESQINYTLFDYNINFTAQDYQYSGNFTC